MKTDLIVATDEAKEGFYPTPPALAGKMLAGLDFRMISSVLEPSAGKGNLVDALARKYFVHKYGSSGLDVDCIEIDPYLRQILKYEFSEAKEKEYYDKARPLEAMLASERTSAQREELARLKSEAEILRSTHVHIVHDDFLTYRSHKPYSLILMNPPFANGDLHLLHAIELQEDGGSIVCLLNAETLRNPYTASRQLLARKLQELNAEITYEADAFSSGVERRARVDVAIVRIHIPVTTPESEIYQRMKEAAEQKEEIPDPEIKALVPGDYLEQAVRMYQVEVDATMELIKEYRALVPFMKKSIEPEGKYESGAILQLVVDHDNSYGTLDVGKYMRLVRLKYWEALFKNEKFTRRLTSKLVERYRSQIERMANYDFSLFNIKQVLFDMQDSMKAGVEDAIMDLFEKLTVEHSWYPECKQNRHYYNGWATNKAHKIGKKCIIPTYGMFSSYSWENGSFSQSTALQVLGDIEKALDYLNAQPDTGYNLSARLAWAHDSGQTRNIELKYFKVDLFKKGTTHIKFLPEAMPIVERLNIYASRKKGWLPPNYGKSTYTKMGDAEKAVVDSFNGDGSAGSGKAAYEDICRKAAFYLADPAQKMPALMAPDE